MSRSGRRGTCVECGQERWLDKGGETLCTTCAQVSLDVPDGDSPCRLDELLGVRNGVTWVYGGSCEGEAS